jgi:hypothetical protein
LKQLDKGVNKSPADMFSFTPDVISIGGVDCHLGTCDFLYFAKTSHMVEMAVGYHDGFYVLRFTFQGFFNVINNFR